MKKEPMHRKKSTPILVMIMITTVILFVFSACTNQNSNLTETDVGEITFYRTEMEHVVTDTEGFMYVDNEILIVANADARYSDIEDLAKGIGAEIVGWIEVTGDYQFKLNQTYTEDQLKELIDSLNKSQFVDLAYINYASQIDSAKTEERNGFYFGDEWEKDLQNFNNCKGDSWGIEAIEVLAAWDILDMYKRNVNPVKVGLIDSAFDTNHEDLGFAETFYNVDSGRDHGTHVAGTMSAKTDNREGICGVYPYGNSNLYGVSYSGICNYSENGSPITTSMFLKIAYAELILRDVKVINSSLGFNYYQWPLSYSDPEWDEQVAFLESNAYVLGDFLDRLLDKGYDFVLVNAAGNDSDRSSGVVYESKYNFWTTVISKEEHPNVYDRIIVVGAVNSDYEICNFSNGGNRVDIFAPGDTIFSTTPNNNYANKNWSGTSMAAPHVSGVAAMVWSVNNDLTGAQVKDIVCSSHSFRCTSCNMVDAYIAMRKATHTYDTTDSTTPTNGAILCWVVSAEDDDIKIENAAVTVCNTQTGEEYSTTTDSMGHFEIFVPEGTYTLVVKAEGYEDFAWPNEDEPYTNLISVDNENVNYLTDWIKMSPNSVSIKDNGMFFLTERPSTDRPGLFTFKEYDLEGYVYETDRGGYTVESFCPSNLNVVANFVGDFTHSGKSTDFTVQKAWDDYYCVEKLCLQIEGVINAYVNDLSLYSDKEVYYYIVDGADTAYLVCEMVEYDTFSAGNGKYQYKTSADSGKDVTESIIIINMSNYTKHTITVEYNTEYLHSSYKEKIEEFMGDSTTNNLFYTGYSNEGQFGNYDDVVAYIKDALSPYGLADRVLSDSSSLSNYTPVYTTAVIGEPKSGSVDNYEDAQIRGKGIVGFPTYTGTWFPDGIVQGPTTPSEGDSAGNDSSSKYEAFLANRGYLSDWTSYDVSSFYTLGSYSFIDIDQNGTDELIIVSNSDIGFLAFMVYTIDENSGEIVRLPVARSDAENNILSCYGEPRYSQKYKALVFSETKPTAMYGGVEYFVVAGDCLYSIGTVGADSFITEGKMTYYSTLSGSYEEISEGDRDGYISELTWLEYNPLP